MESVLQYQGEIENNGYASARKSLARAGGGGGKHAALWSM